MSSLKWKNDSMDNLHITVLEKFIPPYIDYVAEHFDIDKHHFMMIGEPRFEHGLTDNHPVEWVKSIERVTELLENAHRVILHGLWSEEIIKILYTRPHLLQKCIWIMWGGDYYFPEHQSEYKKFVIKNIRYMTSWGSEHQYVIDNYGATGTFFESLLYPYVIYKEVDIPEVTHQYSTVQLGNSADPTNNHSEMLGVLARLNDKPMKIICPLSYSGTREYAAAIAEGGKRLFGDSFVSLLDFMPYDDYLIYLAETDIAFFNHNRQQAMGNIFNLISLGKKVYVGYKPVRDFLQSLGFNIYDPKYFSLTPLSSTQKKENIKVAKEYLKEENYLNHLKMVFELPVN